MTILEEKKNRQQKIMKKNLIMQKVNAGNVIRTLVKSA